ncbi:MAG: TonB-dependent receptor [Cyclobacteriaceae bacterium]|nr:TonB-dependent receptor [Cyclobacteriaceae bacterium]
MKNKFIRQAIVMSRIAFIVICVQAFLATMLIASDGNAQKKLRSIEEIYLSIDLNNTTLAEAFRQISHLTQFNFAYDMSKVNTRKRISTSIENASLAEVLREISRNTNLQFKRVNENIFVSVRDKGMPDLMEIGLDKKQDLQVSGVVRGQEDKSPLPGVNVVIKGTLTGTVTDLDGRYSINVPAGSSLVFSSVGYLSEEVEVGNRSVIDITLTADITALDEIVVVGYGTQRKRDLTGSIGVASSDEFGDVTVGNVQQLLQGKIAGVQVVNANGIPGATPRIVIRGTGSFTSASPLYVIDGIQGGAGDFNSISPYDIEDITVLKDAASVAIYGAQGANGVVIVTTKRAKTGAPKITYNGYVGVSQAWNKLDLLNAREYVGLVKDIADAQGSTVPPKLNSQDVLVDRTDWQDEIFRTAKLTEHHINMSGGTDKSTYNISFGYTSQDAIIIDRNFQRFNFRVNLEQKVGSRIRLGQNFNMRYTLEKGNTADFIGALRMPPYAPTRDPENLGGFSRVTTIEDLNDAFNPLTNVFLSERRNRDLLNYFQLFGEVDILPGLTFKSQFSINPSFYHDYNYIQANRNGNLTNPNNISENYSYFLRPIFENFFTYNKIMGRHAINVVAGNTYSNGSVQRNVSLDGSDFPNDDLRHIGIAPQSRISGGGAGLNYSNLLSYFGRVNYILDDKYIANFTFRRDGSPAFGSDNRFGNFPSIGLGWKIDEESFMQGVDFISTLKLRASWGITGNSNIGLFRTSPVIWRGDQQNIVYSLGPDADMVQGATINTAPNPALKWEETTQIDIGLDVGLFSNALFISLDYYDRRNDDLLVEVPIPLSTGIGGPYDFPGRLPINAASAFNRGLELTTTLNGEKGNFRYNISANVSYNINEVTSLGTEAATPIIDGRFAQVPSITRTDVGAPIGAFYGFRTMGVANQSDVDRLNEQARAITGNPTAVYQASFMPGDIIFKDLNGDGIVNEEDQEFIGSPIPKWNYGFNAFLNYKNFDFQLVFQGVGGVDIINGLDYWMMGTTRPFNGSARLLDRWRQDGDITDVPRAGQNANADLNLRPSDRYLENGAFLRLRNLTVGYTLPSSLMQGSKVFSNFRIYVTGQNLLTFTEYSGYDPEIMALGGGDRDFLFRRGIDFGVVPQPRSYLLGVQIGF